MVGLDWRAIEAAELKVDPFDHFTVAQALDPRSAATLRDDFPRLRAPGSFSLEDAPPGPALAALIAELGSLRFRRQMERIFALDLGERPLLFTLRGQCAARDGRIHTDSKTKLVSLLLYLNETWESPDGRLRLLRSGRDLDMAAVEIPPTFGSLVGFRRSERSWHGHSSYVGPRRVLQLNYLCTESQSRLGLLRHRVSALWKPRAAA
jgi:hypothetical protein